jgi:hypothetical protein
MVVSVIRRTLRLGLWLGLLVGIGFAVAKLLRPRSSPATIDLGSPGGSLGPTPEAWPPLQSPAATPAPIQIPEPAVEPIPTDEPGLVLIGDEPLQTPPEAKRGTLSKLPDAAAPSKRKAKTSLPPWIAPDADGVCPTTHPVKAKLASGIFQVEGNAMYVRTRPDRCYQTPDSAVADGLRPAKR